MAPLLPVRVAVRVEPIFMRGLHAGVALQLLVRARLYLPAPNPLDQFNQSLPEPTHPMPDSPALPRISVIVPAYQAEQHIVACLVALNRQTLPRSEYEILLMDDGSTDETARVSAPLADRVTMLPNGGPGVARNRGAELARGEILVFTDADCIAESDFLERLCAPFADPELAGAKGSYRTAQQEPTARFVQYEYEDRYRHMAGHERIDFVDTYAAAFRREVFLRFGGYHPVFPTACVEDQEFSFRLAAAGLDMRFVREAVVWHRHANTVSGYFRKKRKIAYWKSLVLRLHPGKAVRDSHTPQRVKVQVLLTYGLLASLLFGLLLPGWSLGGLGLAALLLSVSLEVPFMVRFWHRDPLVALLTPLYVWVRSLALGLGLIEGWWEFRAAHPLMRS